MEQWIGACRFCGQTSGVPGKYATQTEADDAATHMCDCDAAKKAKALEIGKMKLQEMFSHEPEEVVLLLQKIMTAVGTGEVEAVSIKIEGGKKCKMSINSKGYIDVQRIDTMVKHETV